MESPAPKVRYAIYATVTEVTYRERTTYVSGYGDKTVTKQEPLGWFAYLSGSHEALHLGMEKPNLAKGDKVKITVEKVS